MCRLMAYYGDTMLLARTILWPDRSFIRQSYDARERLLDHSLPAHLGHGNLNADGFGIGWYSLSEPCEASTKGIDKQTPCTFKSITPAWNNDNLIRLASKICSPLVFAHVRAAYPDMPVSEQNVRAWSQSGTRVRART
jgi:glutamine amidotransferase